MAKSGSKTKKKSKKEKLGMERKTIWDSATAKQKKEIMDFAQGYMEFLDIGKTERLAASAIVEKAEKAGFRDVGAVKTVRAGSKFYVMNRNKSVALVIVGSEPLENGVNIVASHIDAPRLDLKQHPLYEDGETKLALLKTHYYGGIKKYQWVSRPLAIHGVVALENGKTVEIHIGDGPGDPVFTIADLLPHLGKNQRKRKLSDGIKGEELNVLVGGTPLKGEKKQAIKMGVLDHLNKKYKLKEEDLISAELEIVPADNAKDVGFDRSMIGAYGQDDRASAYPQLISTLEARSPKRTCISLFADKEEIGSEGNTGMNSRFLERVMVTIAHLTGDDSNMRIMDAFNNSRAISADVNAGINPTFKDVHESRNASRIGYGVVLTKFTGSGGKYRSNDAHAEFVAFVRNVYNKNKVPWQAAELGKVDEGGGGTIAYLLAWYGMDVIDSGPCLLAMHSPFEISSKADIWATYKAFSAFFASK